MASPRAKGFTSYFVTERLRTTARQCADALVPLLTDLQHSGFLIALVFLALWLLPMGYRAFTSDMFPKSLGVLLIIACFTYLIHVPFVFLWPDVGTIITPFPPRSPRCTCSCTR